MHELDHIRSVFDIAAIVHRVLGDESDFLHPFGFEDKGFKDVEFYVVDGRMPCAIAVITKK